MTEMGPAVQACEQEAKRTVDGTYAALITWQEEIQKQQMLFQQGREELEKERQELEKERQELAQARADFELERQRMVAEHVSPTDVIGINMGGEKVVQVKRALLTQFEGSFLASQFSGRWESMVPRDKDGNVFFDDPPELLMPLVNWLRECRDNPAGRQAKSPSIDPAFRERWTWMLDRYGLLDPKAESDSSKDEMAKITNDTPGKAWFWYKTTSTQVEFKYKGPPDSSWRTDSRKPLRIGEWMKSGYSLPCGKGVSVSVWIDGSCKHEWSNF